MNGLCDVKGCRERSFGFVDTEYIIPQTKDRYIAHVDLCPLHGTEIPIRIRKLGAISIDHVNTWAKKGPYKKYSHIERVCKSM